MNRLNFNIKDRKKLALGLCLILVCVFTLTIAYAALNTVLTIQGTAQVSSADWDIHLANPKVTIGSATTTTPTIKTSSTMDFSTTLNMPGDFYEFTVDVVNSGSIDAMIENVIKNPELTTEQARYLNYEVTYQNGESITTNQTLAHGTTMPIKVRVEYRRDISASDLPTTQTKLDLSLTLEYIQSDGTGIIVKDNGASNLVGNEVCIGEECFFVISSTVDTVTMLAKYNLYVGGEYNGGWTEYGEEATGKQDVNMKGWVSDDVTRKGTKKFSSTSYWSSTVSTYPAYVYDSNSIMYNYVENYKKYLSTLGVTPSDARLITYEELKSLGCSEFSCTSAPSWVYSTTYWSGSAYDSDYVFRVNSKGELKKRAWADGVNGGCRPVITISRSLI